MRSYVVFGLLPALAAALDNGLGKLPGLGWNSDYCANCTRPKGADSGLEGFQYVVAPAPPAFPRSRVPAFPLPRSCVVEPPPRAHRGRHSRSKTRRARRGTTRIRVVTRVVPTAQVPGFHP